MVGLPADTNNPLLVSAGFSLADTKIQPDFLYGPLKWADTNIVIFGSVPLKYPA
jgi:hypothetical protein